MTSLKNKPGIAMSVMGRIAAALVRGADVRCGSVPANRAASPERMLSSREHIVTRREPTEGLRPEPLVPSARTSGRRVRCEDLAGPAVALEDHPRGLAVADLSRDLHAPERRPVATGLRTKAEFRGGDVVVLNRLAIAEQEQALVAHADQQLVAGADFVPAAGPAR